MVVRVRTQRALPLSPASANQLKWLWSRYTTVHYNVEAEANSVFSHEERRHNGFWLRWYTLKISRVSLLARDVLPATKACLCTFIWPSLAKVGSPTHSPLHWKRIWSLLPSRVNTLVWKCIARSGRDLWASWVCLCLYQAYANGRIATFQQWLKYIVTVLWCNIRILNKKMLRFIDLTSVV